MMIGFFEYIFPIFFIAIFVIVIGTFIVTAVRSVSQWNKNNNSPRLTVTAKVVAKRSDMSVRRHHHANGHTHRSTSTYYYVTFEVESGDRMELLMDGYEYGMLVEGDCGKLTFQGTRYLGFERE